MHKTSPDESKELPGQVPVPKSLQRRNTTRASFTAESYGLDQETIRSSFRGISETAEFKQELKQLIHSYDTNNDGTFDEDEVERIVRDVKQAAFHAQEIEKGAKAIAEGLNKQEDRAKMFRNVMLFALGLIVVLVALIGGITYSVVEGTKESRVEKHGTDKSALLVAADGTTPVVTVKDSSHVKLSELSRASLEYLSNIEDITLASKGRVYHFTITGYSLYDSDNLDLHTSTATVLKVQCGAVRISWADGKFEDADEMHPEATLAGRQLRAMSTDELRAHFEAHASASTRKLAAENPLKGLTAFFGGMAKSSANSELYGALQPVTGCKKPAAIISFARPTIPASSKWTIEVNKAVKDAKTTKDHDLQDDVWYLSWDKVSAPSFRFESPQTECQKIVSIDADGVTSTWSEFDSKYCLHAGKVSNTFECPNPLPAGQTCEQIKADLITSGAKALAAQNGFQTQCVEEKKAGVPTSEDDVMSTRILDVLKDGSAVWMFGGLTMEVDIKGTPTKIVDTDAGSSYKISKIEAFDPLDDDTLFKGCKTNPGKQTQVATASGSGRRLSFTQFQAWASNTQWCGSGTDLTNTPCPNGGGDYQADKACRRHDHGNKHESAGLGVKLECLVDKELDDAQSNWAAKLIFGKWGLAMTWGCFNWEKSQNCKIKCGWRGCRRTCTSSWGWETRNSPWRYSGARTRTSGGWNRYVDKKKTCRDDLW